MISDSIEKLGNYNDKAKARMNVLKYREKDIQEGSQLLFEIWKKGDISSKAYLQKDKQLSDLSE